MGKSDIQTSGYLEDNRRFADLVNVALFQGTRTVLPEQLLEASPELVFTEGETEKKLFQDKVKMWNGDTAEEAWIGKRTGKERLICARHLRI